MEIKSFKSFSVISFIFLVHLINFTKSFTKYCDNKYVFEVGLKSVCESKSGMSVSCFKHPKKVYLQCNDGYYNERNISVQIIECMENGQWSDTPMQCIPICIEFPKEFNSLEINNKNYPKSYAEIIRKNPIENETNIYPGIIFHERKVVFKCDFFKEEDSISDFLVRIHYSATRTEEFESEHPVVEWVRKISYNDEKKFCLYSLRSRKYIKFDKNIAPICESVLKRELAGPSDDIGLLYEYRNKCFVPDIDISKVEIVCFNERGYHNFETLAEDGKFTFNELISEFKQEECEEHNTAIVIRCRLGYENVKSNDIPYISYCFEGEWKYEETESNDCKNVCGEVDPKYDEPLTPLLYNGVETNIISAPWHVAIFANNTYLSYKSFTQICGGSIIHSNIVISAAHCFYDEGETKLYDPSNFLVGAGKRYRNIGTREENEYYNFVKDIHIPLTYTQQPIQDDVAVLILEEHFKFSSHIKPVCIEWRLYKDYLIHERAVGRTFGWGAKSRAGGPSNGLLTIDLHTLKHSECRDLVKPNIRSRITNEKFCAINKNNATACRGDSGGGFVVKKGFKDEDYYILAGIISVGLDVAKECSEGFLSLFANIQFQQDFIKAKVHASRNKVLDIGTYKNNRVSQLGVIFD